jgi:hypothetical protein
MKVFDRVKRKIKRYLNKKQAPVIVIPRRDPWEGEKWVRVQANNPYKKIVMQRE